MTCKGQRHGYVLFPSLEADHFPVIFRSDNTRSKELSITYWHYASWPLTQSSQRDRQKENAVKLCFCCPMLTDLRKCLWKIDTIFSINISFYTHTQLHNVWVVWMCSQCNSRNVSILLTRTHIHMPIIGQDCLPTFTHRSEKNIAEQVPNKSRQGTTSVQERYHDSSEINLKFWFRAQ